MIRIRAVLAAVLGAAAAAACTLAAAAPASAKVISYTVTASTAITARPDSGDHGYWALDRFTRTASVHLAGEVPLADCGGSTPTGHCYHWTGKISDHGSFTTIPGATSPGAGDLNGGSPPAIGETATGSMTGVYFYSFDSSWKTARAGLMPRAENSHGKVTGGRATTGAWPEQFFGASARFYTSGAASTQLGTIGRWVYQLNFGADHACPHLASKWVDSSWPATAPWGTAPYQGNILAPAAAHC